MPGLVLCAEGIDESHKTPPSGISGSGEENTCHSSIAGGLKSLGSGGKRPGIKSRRGL